MSSRIDVLSLCLSRTSSLRDGRKLAQFITEWELAVRAAGGPINVDEYAAYWQEEPRTGYRKLVIFRAAFPELGDRGMPQDLMQPLLADLEDGVELAPLYPLSRGGLDWPRLSPPVV